jgi:hypothetical protein
MDDATDPPPKKRRTINPSILPDILSGPELRVVVPRKTANSMDLLDPTVISIVKLEWITFNSTECGYLYYICATLFEVDGALVNLYRTLTGDEAARADDWLPVEEEDQICRGVYMLTFDEAACTTP